MEGTVSFKITVCGMEELTRHGKLWPRAWRRRLASALCVRLSILPLALIGGEVMRGFPLAIMFGIIIGTFPSIFIASAILLFLGQRGLRPAVTRVSQPSGFAAAP